MLRRIRTRVQHDAGIALIIAALTARGRTEIDNIYQIERGYENIADRLSAIGADIKKI